MTPDEVRSTIEWLSLLQKPSPGMERTRDVKAELLCFLAQRELERMEREDDIAINRVYRCLQCRTEIRVKWLHAGHARNPTCLECRGATMDVTDHALDPLPQIEDSTP